MNGHNKKEPCGSKAQVEESKDWHKASEYIQQANENLRRANRYLLCAAVFAVAWAIILITTTIQKYQ